MAMSQREKFLAIAVAGVVGVIGIQFVIGSIRSGLEIKQRKLDALNRKIEEHDRKLTDCALATKRLNDLKSKSLPKNSESANNQYSSWLIELGSKSNLRNLKVELAQAGGLRSDAYTAHAFSLTGEIRIDDFIKLMHRYYDRDYLQRIRTLKMEPMRDNPDMINLKMVTEVLALKSADLKQPPSLASSGRVPESVDEYIQSILSRNPFAPPNKAPKFSLASTIDVPRDSDWSLDLKAADPDARHKVKFTLLSETPEGLRFSEDSGKISWRPKTNGTYELMLKVADNGFPPKESEQKLTLKVVDPPPPPKVVETPKFDVASQSYVSAI